jgi:polyhydroxyalkanoate synthase subunit PhaC
MGKKRKKRKGDGPAHLGESYLRPTASSIAGLSKPAAPEPADTDPAPRIAGQPKPIEPKSSSMPQSATPDFDRLSQNLALMVGRGGEALAALFEPSAFGGTNGLADTVLDAVKSFGRIAEYWLADPQRTVEAQTALSSDFLSLWAHTLRRLSGEAAEPVVPHDPADKRFAAPQWRESPIFDFLRQAHAISTGWAETLVERADIADPRTKQKAQFYVRQISSALSPSNFIGTNPELLHETLASSGENLVRGISLLTEDIKAGGGTLRIRQSDSSKFELGVNMAATPGKVIFRNELMELIQYAPATEQVLKRPLLLIPPWINKYYILDLNAEKSFVRFAVEQGLTVFLISWVNPDARHRDKGFEAYLKDAVFTALDVIAAETGEESVHTLGFCVGGTLLSIALALMARRQDKRIASATFLATQTDFTDAGDLQVFLDEEQIRANEESMAEKGYLDGAKMASVFNMLRPNDLIWSFVVNNYMRGQTPLPFDLLTWNSDSTRMAAANHSFYLRSCYLENRLAKGKMVIAGEKLDLSEVDIPIYSLATREDHIAPARSVFTGMKLFGSEVRFVLAGSGHIAGVINPAEKPKYQYWTGPRLAGAFEDWLEEASERPGSWWLDWINWIKKLGSEKVPARTPGSGKFPPLCDAPGEYVRVKS